MILMEEGTEDEEANILNKVWLLSALCISYLFTTMVIYMYLANFRNSGSEYRLICFHMLKYWSWVIEQRESNIS